jgi:hypothetical protein
MLAVIGMKGLKYEMLFPASFILILNFQNFLFDPVYRDFKKNMLERGSVLNKSNTKANLHEKF